MNQPARFCSVILSAGMGSRLKPLTDHTPKALTRLGGIELIDLCRYRLMQIQQRKVATNTHYLAKKVHSHLTQRGQLGLPPVQIQHEPVLRGSAGVYDGLRNWIGSNNILALNSDVISTQDLTRLLDAFYKHDQEVCLAVRPIPHASGHHVWVHGDRVVSISSLPPSGNSSATPHGFASAQAIPNSMMQNIPSDRTSEIMPIYRRLLSEGKHIRAVELPGFWHDLGTPVDYFNAHMELLQQFDKIANAIGITYFWGQSGKFEFVRNPTKIENASYFPHSIRHRGAKVMGYAKIGPNVVMNGTCTIGKGAEIQDCVLLPGAHVPANQRLKDFIIGEAFKVKLSRQLTHQPSHSPVAYADMTNHTA